jgi:hypothetical protein
MAVLPYSITVLWSLFVISKKKCNTYFIVIMITEMDFWRRSAGKSRRERIRNERIREMKVNTTIVEDIRTNQLRWYGHVVRMEKERLPKQVLLWTPQGRRRK